MNLDRTACSTISSLAIKIASPDQYDWLAKHHKVRCMIRDFIYALQVLHLPFQGC